MDLFNKHLAANRKNEHEMVLTDEHLQFADVDPMSSDSELEHLVEGT